MTLTLDDIKKFEELEHQRDRNLAQGYTHSNIPTSLDHKKYIEYKELKQSIESLLPAGAVPNELTADRLSFLDPVTSLVRSTIPTQDPNAVLDLLLRYAGYNSSVTQASTPQPHIWPQAQAALAHSLSSGPFCGLCILANHPHPPLPIGTLAHGLPPARPHGLERNPINTPATDYRVTEIMPRTENEQVAAEEEGECEDEVGRESTHICLYLGKNWHSGMSADVYHDSTENWISDKLLRHPDDVIEPSQRTVAYRAPDGILLESRGFVKVDYRLKTSGKTFPGILFQVHTSWSRGPHIILGRTWAQKHGAAVLVSRPSGNSKDRNAQRPQSKHIRSNAFASNRITKLSHRPRITHHEPQMSR